MNLLYLNYLSKDPTSESSLILRYWGLRRQHLNLGGHNSAHNPLLVAELLSSLLSLAGPQR